jgi:hypothetical protein
MIELNVDYIEEIKQELVNTVAESRYIVPEIFSRVCIMPIPTVETKYHTDKMELRRQRRKAQSEIWNESANPVQDVILYQIEELITFLDKFPQFQKVIK